MSFWNRIKMGLQKFMTGRNGPDELSLAMLIISLIVSLISSIVGSIVLNLVSMVLYILVIFRIFSRNVEKRYAENQKYVTFRQSFRRSCSQAWVRLKNSKKYKYFKCPQCHAWLRLPRKVGEVTVTCGKCHHAFKKKA